MNKCGCHNTNKPKTMIIAMDLITFIVICIIIISLTLQMGVKNEGKETAANTFNIT